MKASDDLLAEARVVLALARLRGLTVEFFPGWPVTAKFLADTWSHTPSSRESWHRYVGFADLASERHA